MKIKSILICLLIAITANSFTAAKAQVNVNDSLALVDLYNSTNGPHWYIKTNWLSDKPVSTWYGITVTGTRVTRIRIVANTMAGPIPSSISNITELESLDLNTNFLSGPIPSSIGNFAHLTDLFLNTNELSGSIPSSIGDLTNLEYLALYTNHLTGSIPSSIGNLTNLVYLYLAYNQLSGSIPSSIGKLKNLYYLYLYTNKLSGSIPSSIGDLANLGDLDLDDNELSGEIPYSFKNLTNLLFFDLSYNKLTQLSNLNYLGSDPVYKTGYLNENRFTFNGLEFVAQKFFGVRYDYQARISIHQHGNVLSVSAGGTLKNNTYRWFIVGQKKPVIIKGDSTFTPSTNGKYYAEVTNAIAKQLTLITDTITYTMPVAQSQNTIANLAAVNTTTNHFSIYPNPAKDIVHIQTNGSATIVLTNSLGKIVLSKTINNRDAINVSSYANGVYYIQNKTTGEVQKIIVSH